MKPLTQLGIGFFLLITLILLPTSLPQKLVFLLIWFSFGLLLHLITRYTSFSSFFSKTESVQAPLWAWIITLACLWFLRDTLELVLEGVHHFGSPLLRLEYFIFWIAIFLSLWLILSLSGKSFATTGKFLVLFWALSYVPLFVDTITYESPNMSYFFSSISQQFITFMQPTSYGYEATLGIRIETLLAVLLVSFYVYSSTLSLFRSWLAGLLTYTAIWHVMSAQVISSWLFPTLDSIYLRLLIYNLSFSFIIFVLITSFIRLSRPRLDFSWPKGILSYTSRTLISHRSLFYISLFLLGTFYAIFRGWGTLPEPFELVAIFTAIAVGWATIVLFNDYFDREIDAVSNKARFAVITPPSVSYLLIATAVGILSVVLVSLVRFDMGMLYLAWILLYTVPYSIPPFRLRRYLLVPNIIIGINIWIIFFLGILSVTGPKGQTYVTPWFALGWILFGTLASTMKDIKDYSGDKQAGVSTLVTYFGMRVGTLVTLVLLSISAILLTILFSISIVSYTILIFGTIMILLLMRYSEKPFFVCWHVLSLLLILFFHVSSTEPPQTTQLNVTAFTEGLYGYSRYSLAEDLGFGRQRILFFGNPINYYSHTGWELLNGAITPPIAKVVLQINNSFELKRDYIILSKHLVKQGIDFVVENRDLVWYDQHRSSLGTLSPPFVQDATGTIYNLSFYLNRTNSTLTIGTFIPSEIKKILVYPVVVDPVLNYSGLTSDGDIRDFISGSECSAGTRTADTSCGTACNLGVDLVGGRTPSCEVWHFYAAFNTTPIVNNVLSAKLWLYVRANAGAAGVTINMHHDDWGPTLTTADYTITGNKESSVDLVNLDAGSYWSWDASAEAINTSNITYLALEVNDEEAVANAYITLDDADGTNPPLLEVTIDPCPPTSGQLWLVNETTQCTNQTIDVTNMVVEQDINITGGTVNVGGELNITNGAQIRLVNSTLNVSRTMIVENGAVFQAFNGSSTIWQNGNLTISGKYELDNEILRMNGTVDGGVGIQVTSTGTMTIKQSSNVTNGEVSAAEYFFIVDDGASFTLINSTISEAGWSDEYGKRGLEINTTIANISANRFTGNFYSLTLYKPIEVQDLNLTANSGGIVVNTSNANITNLRVNHTAIHASMISFLGHNNVLRGADYIGTAFSTAITLINASNNEVYNINTTLGGISAQLIGKSENTIIADSVLSSSTQPEVSISGGNLTLINTTIDTYSVLNNSLEVQWHLQLNVTTTAGAGISTANISIYDANLSLLRFNVSTDGSGLTVFLNVTAFVDNTSDVINHTPHNITVDAADYYSNSSLFTLTTSQTYSLELHALSDLSVASNSINFSDTSPVESQIIDINATIVNSNIDSVENVLVAFYDGNYTLNDNIGNVTIAVINGTSNITVNQSWVVGTGTHEIFVAIDPPVNTGGSVPETNENNNLASAFISVSSYQINYGNLSGNFGLTDAANRTVFDWQVVNVSNSNVFVIDIDSSITWSSLFPFTECTSKVINLSHFQDLDLTLNLTSFSDRLNSTYIEVSEEVPAVLNKTDYIIFGQQINGTPSINSTNNSLFRTGILWDSSDDGAGLRNCWDGEDVEDILFVSQATKAGAGKFGIYDYEIAYPARLGNLHTTTLQQVAFYIELA